MWPGSVALAKVKIDGVTSDKDIARWAATALEISISMVQLVSMSPEQNLTVINVIL